MPLYLISAFVAEPRPSFTGQVSDEEAPTTGANEIEAFGNSVPQNETVGENSWEVVSTSNEPATSIDGAANSSAEAFVQESNIVAAAAAAAASGVKQSFEC